jgi:hypothetical protein
MTGWPVAQLPGPQLSIVDAPQYPMNIASTKVAGACSTRELWNRPGGAATMAA